jgi:predicted house-cleaning noncanonical NTP pyrophosphatase (MazG superfamily)
LEAEAKDRTDADKKLQSNIDSEAKRIDAILDGSTVDLDQFKEVVEFVQSIDLENDADLLKAVTDINKAIDSEIEARELADSELDDKISDILSNTDITAIDSFTEVIVEVNSAFDSAYKNSYDFTIANRPYMVGFNESPEMIDSGEFDENDEAIMVLRDTFTSDVVQGTQIVFLNGLMLLEGSDYSVNDDGDYEFNEAPALTDLVNIYGVVEPKRPAGHIYIGAEITK